MTKFNKLNFSIFLLKVKATWNNRYIEKIKYVVEIKFFSAYFLLCFFSNCVCNVELYSEAKTPNSLFLVKLKFCYTICMYAKVSIGILFFFHPIYARKEQCSLKFFFTYPLNCNLFIRNTGKVLCIFIAFLNLFLHCIIEQFISFLLTEIFDYWF